VIVGADGAVSSVAKHFSMGGIKRFVLTYKAEYGVSTENMKKVDLFFDRKMYPGLFAWLCPNSSEILEVGVGVDSRSGNAKSAFDNFVRTDYVSKILDGAKALDEGASLIPMSLRERIVDGKNGVVLVGDAAGEVKATTGGGVIFGGNAAIIASDVIRRHIKEGEPLETYRKEFMRRYSLELKLHGAIRRLYSSLDSGHIGKIISVLNFLGADEFLGEYGDMDMPSRTIKRFFLRGLVG